MTLDDFDTAYVVEVHSPLLSTTHLRGFDERADAEAFMDACRETGCRIGAAHFTPKALGNLTLHGREGMTVRPEPAAMAPKAKT